MGERAAGFGLYMVPRDRIVIWELVLQDLTLFHFPGFRDLFTLCLHAYIFLVGKREGRRPLGRPRHRWEGNIK